MREELLTCSVALQCIGGCRSDTGSGGFLPGPGHARALSSHFLLISQSSSPAECRPWLLQAPVAGLYHPLTPHHHPPLFKPGPLAGVSILFLMVNRHPSFKHPHSTYSNTSTQNQLILTPNTIKA